MVKKIKADGEPGPSLLKWIIILTPIAGLVTYMAATHDGRDSLTAAKLTAGVVAALWLVSYLVIRSLRWRGRRSKGPTSLPPE